MPQEEGLDLHEFLLGDPDIAAILQSKRPPQIMGGEIIDIGPKKATECAAENGNQHVHLPGLGKITGSRHDQLTGDRDDRTLHRHQDKYPRIAHGPYTLHEPVNYSMHLMLLLSFEHNFTAGSAG